MNINIQELKQILKKDENEIEEYFENKENIIDELITEIESNQILSYIDNINVELHKSINNFNKLFDFIEKIDIDLIKLYIHLNIHYKPTDEIINEFLNNIKNFETYLKKEYINYIEQGLIIDFEDIFYDIKFNNNYDYNVLLDVYKNINRIIFNLYNNKYLTIIPLTDFCILSILLNLSKYEMIDNIIKVYDYYKMKKLNEYNIYTIIKTYLKR